MIDKEAYLRRETIVTIVVSTILSAGFYLLVFGWGKHAAVWGMGAYAFDMVIQSVAIGLLATLVPGLLCRKAIMAGKVADGANTPPPVSTLIGRAFLFAIATVLIGAGLFALLLWVSGLQMIEFLPAIFAKIGYGVIAGAIVTRRFLNKML